MLTAATEYRLGNLLLEAGRFDDTRDVVLHAADTIVPGKSSTANIYHRACANGAANF